MVIDPQYGMIVDADIGEVVFDDLTHESAEILDKRSDEFGNVGYWLSSRCGHWDDDGGRFPWEISPPVA